MTPPDESLPALKHEVERLLGQCLLRLQAFEFLTKSILAAHQLSAPVANIEKAQADRAAETERKTLGALVGEMMGTFLVPKGHEGLREEREAAPSVAFRHQIVFSVEDFDRIKADHRELVALRNTLVHHFLLQHALHTPDGCLVAQRTLRNALEQIHRAYSDLQCWARDLDQNRKTIADYLSSPEFLDLIVHGRVPHPVKKIAEEFS